jgi:hypothetical protein
MLFRIFAALVVVGAFAVQEALPDPVSEPGQKLSLSLDQQTREDSPADSEELDEIRLVATKPPSQDKLKLEPEFEKKPRAEEKALPLPFHTIEGYGGGAITPMAYLVNPGPKGTILGLPAVSFTYINMRKKDLEALAVTETLFRRIELGYALDRFGLGSLPGDIQNATGVDIDRNQIYLHNFNIRTLLVEENSFKLPLPALTTGVHFKINDGIMSINRKLGGGLSAIGLDQDNGVEFTFTGTKMFPKVFGRPLFLSAGFRNSSAAWLGFMGFASERNMSFETNAVYMPTDWLVLAYEFRNNPDPYKTIPGLVGKTDNWNCFHLAFVINKHCTFCLGYGLMGNMANTTENSALAAQFKYEF